MGCLSFMCILLQEALKFMHKAKRRKLSSSDFDNSLRVRNVEVWNVFAFDMTKK